MIAVIFEVEPSDDRKDAYFDLAADLRPLLGWIDGFLSIERFESLVNPGKILSLSFWRDEQAIAAWRRIEKHRQRTVGRTRRDLSDLSSACRRGDARLRR